MTKEHDRGETPASQATQAEGWSLSVHTVLRWEDIHRGIAELVSRDIDPLTGERLNTISKAVWEVLIEGNYSQVPDPERADQEASPATTDDARVRTTRSSKDKPGHDPSS